jgi:hypothetical protein
MSSPFPQDASDPGERLIDASRDLSELRVFDFTSAPADPASGLEPGHRSIEPFNRRFELGHRPNS